MKLKLFVNTVIAICFLSIAGLMGYQFLHLVNPERRIADRFDIRELPDGNVEVFVERKRSGVYIACYYIRQAPKHGSKVFANQCLIREIPFERDLVGRISNVSGSDRRSKDF